MQFPKSTVRFLCGSQYDETLTGTEGEIITVRLCVDRYMLDGQYLIVLKNVKLTETDINVTDIMGIANIILKVGVQNSRVTSEADAVEPQ